jgi:hypothetical protein
MSTTNGADSGGRELELTVASTPATIDDLEWQRQADQARLVGLATIQVAAERWGTTLLATTGLLTTLTAVLGARDVGLLRDTSTRVWAGIFSLCAVLVAGSAVVLAALAAQGRLSEAVLSGPSLRALSLAHAKTAARQLRASRILSLFILPLFLTAIAIVAYSPRATTNQMLITTEDGRTICATSVTESPAGALVLTVANDSNRVTLQPKNLRELKVVARCS